MDILYLVDRLENLIASSRHMPLVNQIILKESDVLNIIEQMRTAIPDEVKQARRIIQEKEHILARAQADATTLLTRAREESERAMNREGLLRGAEDRSRSLLQQAEEQAQELAQQAAEHAEHLKADADSYVMETLRNLRDHLTIVETDVSRTILSIERGLDSLEKPQREPDEDEDAAQQLSTMDDAIEDEPPNIQHLSRSGPRRASLAADTMGGPNY